MQEGTFVAVYWLEFTHGIGLSIFIWGGRCFLDIFGAFAGHVAMVVSVLFTPAEVAHCDGVVPEEFPFVVGHPSFYDDGGLIVLCDVSLVSISLELFYLVILPWNVVFVQSTC